MLAFNKLKRGFYNKYNFVCSYIGYLFSKTIIYSLYFNFRYLPFRQAINLPILIYDTLIIGRPKIKIDSRNIAYGMIRIGRVGHNLWSPKKSTITFWGNGHVIFYGKCKLARSSHLRVMDSGVLSFGDNFYASSNYNIQCAKGISIGNNVTFGWDCTVIDTDYHHYIDECKRSVSLPEKEIEINDNCWIGFSTIILKGTIVHSHTIISAGSVVSGDLRESHVIVKTHSPQIIKSGVSIDQDRFW